eukprot:Pompholyxophrys_punicea_v1_NODE_317_length_2277_cov_3.387663.p3 type:complete len:109 gc:universal NODE_317_length_2277_cov_3.387663:1220-894(-)
MTSQFDFVGPYFFSKQGFVAQSLMACVYDTMRMGEIFGFGVMLLVTDGAAENLRMFKPFLGHYKTGQTAMFRQQYVTVHQPHLSRLPLSIHFVMARGKFTLLSVQLTS